MSRLLVLLVALWSLAARAQTPPAAGADPGDEPAVGASALAPPAPSATYQVGPGDVLQVQVYGEAGLSGAFPVDDGGHLNYPFLGRVEVGGLTANQVAERLTAGLADGYLVEPSLTVWLQGYNSQPVQVLGAVKKPGQYYLKGQTTVLQLLSEAGGVSLAGVNEIRVTHGADDDDVTVLPYERLLKKGEGNITLRGGDIVFVPESLVSVMGEVKQPGNVSFRENLTVSTCIAAAGGALPTANLRKVTILRGDQRIQVNVKKVLAGKAPDVPIETGDRIVVGESVF